jgi:predicted dehydrogenase
MVEAAEKAGAVTQVGFNYIKNPLLKMARDMVAAGELGEITGFRGIHAEDYMHDPESPYTWRIDPVGGPGVIADLGSHHRHGALPAGADHAGECRRAHREEPSRWRRGAKERGRAVDDVAHPRRFRARLRRHHRANWIATGRKMQLGFRLTGEKGSLVFTRSG